MTTALYRRYRPETFAEMIGQSQVTDPLMTALRADRVGHAYLFSGPRGCGKTTSARILARCLNCAEGPTDTPCGVCDSCVELARGGSGSLDVVEIDAASHNGVDDARDLRERAVFAPARDRFKIFILDEAHMVTQQGFNALLKLVEEPPPHVKFIFATTEPEKVLGTIRSRTHHYPFRLVPPAAMLAYIEELCAQEGVTVQTGVLPLVVRAGGGSPRDTLSLLDQLIAGSENNTVEYERAVALLGYTHTALLDDVISAFSTGDAAMAFAAVDRVIQTGQDPRRFVDDLLERLRDLIIISATGAEASAVLRGIAEDELARMTQQAMGYGTIRLSQTADVVSKALDDMSGATSPRLHLELLVARVLSADARHRNAGAGTQQAPTAAAAPAVAAAAPAPEPRNVPVELALAESVPEPDPAPEAEAEAESAPESEAAPALVEPEPESVPEPEPQSAPAEPEPEPELEARPETEPAAAASPASAPAVETAPETVEASSADEPVTKAVIEANWSGIVQRLQETSRAAFMVVSNARVVQFDNEVLTLAFSNHPDIAKFKELKAGAGVSEDLRQVIVDVLGVRVKYIAKHESAFAPQHPPRESPSEPSPSGDGWHDDEPPYDPESLPPDDGWQRPPSPRPSTPQPVTAPPRAPQPTRVAPVTEWAVVAIPGGASAPLPVDDEPEEALAKPVAPPHDGDQTPINADGPDGDDEDLAIQQRGPAPTVRSRPLMTGGAQRYGEAVVRQVLGATFVREDTYNPPTRFN